MKDDFLFFDQLLCSLHTKRLKIFDRVYREKVLSAFSDIERDMEDEMDRLEQEYPFDPDREDPADVSLWAYEKGIDYGINLSEAKCLFIALSTVALYHDWEKQIIAFLKREIGRNHDVPNIKKWEHIVKWLEKYDTPLDIFDFYDDLNELRLAANVVKHGKGPSYDELKKLNATILKKKDDGDCSYAVGEFSMLGVALYIEQVDFERYVEAVKQFWNYENWQSIGESRYRITQSND